MATAIEDHPNPYCEYSYNQHFSEPTIIFDMSGIIIYYNSKVINFLNNSEKHLKEKNITSILPNLDLQNLHSRFLTTQKHCSFIQKTLFNIEIRVMIHNFYHSDVMYFCAQFKRPFFKALIVDDNEVCLSILRRHLNNLEFASTEAKSGFEALEKLDSSSSFDVVVTDFVMPKMTGLQQAKKYRKKSDKKTPFILQTSEPLTHDFKTKCKKGHRFQKVIAKPIDRDKLLKALKRVNFPIKKS